MFVLGHIGIGRTLLGPSRWKLPAIAFALGALLPDIIDKSLYYSRLTSYATCTRTFGHTGLFLCALAIVALATRSRVWMALAIGVATHLLLDGFIDLFSPAPSAEWIALTWPFLHRHFYRFDFDSPLQQLKGIFIPPVFVSEVVGALLLVREYRLYRRRAPLPEHSEPGPDGVRGIRPVPIVEGDE